MKEHTPEKVAKGIIWYLSVFLLIGCTNQSDPTVNSAHYEKGLQAYQKGNFDDAVKHIQSYIEHNKIEDKMLANALVVAGASYYEKESYNLSQTYYQKALKLRIGLFGKKHAQVGKLYNNLGNSYAKMQQYTTSNIYFEKALQCDTKKLNVGAIYNNMGMNYLELQQYTQASEYLEQALVHYSKKEKHFAYNNMGINYREQGKYKKAHLYFRKSLEDKKMHLNANSYLLAMTLNNIGYIYHLQGKYKKAIIFYEKALEIPCNHDKTTLEILENKGKTLKALRRPKQALKVLRQADQVITSSRKAIHLESDKLFFAQKTHHINKLAMEIGLKLKEYETVFYFAERDKANILAENLNVSPVKKVKTLQARLKKGQALLEYAFLGNRLLMFGITNDHFETKVIPYDFEKDVNTFLYSTAALLQKHNVLQKGYSLYTKLVKPFEEKFDHINDLIIVPDRRLSRLSFEAMTCKAYKLRQKENLNFYGYDYLIFHYMVSYASSATLAFYPKQTGKYIYDYIGFAPTHQNLPMSVKEVTHSAQFFPKRETYTGNWATSNYFKKIPSPRILHISTHSLYLDSTQNNIAFQMYQDTLTAQEIQETKLHVDLVVLSSCDNVQGRYVKGEGLINLMRVFLPKSNYILYSLFNIEDVQSYNLMGLFYTEVARGTPYKKALHLAKLNIIRRKNTAPLDWAGVVITS